jgi:hypothetical protein
LGRKHKKEQKHEANVGIKNTVILWLPYNPAIQVLPINDQCSSWLMTTFIHW